MNPELLYTSGEYFSRFPDWHRSQSDWKARHIACILRRNRICPTSIAEVGCGTGGVLESLSALLPPTCSFWGWDISPQATSFGQIHNSRDITYSIGSVTDCAIQPDLLLALDVIEHVADPIEFLTQSRGRSRYLLLHVPLDLSALGVLRNCPTRVRVSAGHLHYFTRSLALQLLRETGFRVIDDRYTAPGVDFPTPGIASTVLQFVRRLGARHCPDFTATLLGGNSLLLLAERDGRRSMILAHVLDYRFRRTPDLAVWTDTEYGYFFWARYLTSYSGIRVIARVQDVSSRDPQWHRVDGDGVEVAAVPFYEGAAGYLRQRSALREAIGKHMETAGAVILRVPSQLAICAGSLLNRRERPFALEVVGDPWQSLARGAVRHPLRGFFRYWYTRNQERLARRSAASCYVAQSLRDRYPPGRDTYDLICSDAYLPREAFVDAPQPVRAAQPLRLVTVGTLSQLYKGVDVLIEAVRQCNRRGIKVQVTVIGDGRYRSELVRQAYNRRVDDQIRFLGALAAGSAVREQLDRADVFILPSRTEGMPRALLEAMARGLPCLASGVGDVATLLAAADVVSPGDATSLATAIGEAHSMERRKAMGQRNLATARMFAADLLDVRRKLFFTELNARALSSGSIHQERRADYAAR